MNLKNCKYMNNAEFKDRQNSFDFFCAQAHEYLIAFRNECRKGWQKLFTVRREIKKQIQLNLNFIRKIAEWATWTPEKNRELLS